MQSPSSTATQSSSLLQHASTTSGFASVQDAQHRRATTTGNTPTQYYHRAVSDSHSQWPDAASSSATAGNRNSRSSSTAATPVPGDEDAQGNLTANELRTERESERTRRRLALRKKRESRRGFSASATPTPTSSSQLHSSSNRPNELTHLHPSLQHAAVAAYGFDQASPSLHSYSASSARFPSLSPSGNRNSSSTASFIPHSFSSPGIQSPGYNASSPLKSSSSTGGVHRIDIADEPEDQSTVIERASSSLYGVVEGWSHTQKQKAVSYTAMVSAITSLTFLFFCLSTFNTLFAYPSIHWGGVILAVVGLILAFLLQHSSKLLDVSSLLLWFILSILHSSLLFLFAIVSFHPDRSVFGENVRNEWATVDVIDRVEEFQNSLSEFQNKAELHLHLLGAVSLVMVCFNACGLILIWQIRANVKSSEDYTNEHVSRAKQYQQRLQNRQRMARLSHQMKERRKLRKQRAESKPSSSTSPITHHHPQDMSASSSLSSYFGGVGSNPTGRGTGALESDEDDRPAGGGEQRSREVELSRVIGYGGASHSIHESHSSGGGGGMNASPSPLSPTVPLLAGSTEADEKRYEAMLSEDIENELERIEEKREAQTHAGR